MSWSVSPAHILPSCSFQTSLEHDKAPKDEVWARSCFKQHLTLHLHDVSIRIFALQFPTPAPRVPLGLPEAAAPGIAAVIPPRWHRAQSCDETSGEKGKANSRFIGVWFTSLNYFPPSSALPPLGNASPSLHAGIWKNQVNSKCLQGRHQTKLGHNSSLPAGTENTTKIPTTQFTQCLQRHLSGRSRD